MVFLRVKVVLQSATVVDWSCSENQEKQNYYFVEKKTLNMIIRLNILIHYLEISYKSAVHSLSPRAVKIHHRSWSLLL